MPDVYGAGIAMDWFLALFSKSRWRRRRERTLRARIAALEDELRDLDTPADRDPKNAALAIYRTVITGLAIVGAIFVALVVATAILSKH